MTEIKSPDVRKMEDELETAKKDIKKILTNDLVHMQEDIDNLTLNIKHINHFFLKDIGITIGATMISFILMIWGIFSNFLFYSVAGLLLLLLSLVHASGRNK